MGNLLESKICDIHLSEIKKMEVFSIKCSRYSKEHCFLEGFQTSPVCPSGKSNMCRKLVWNIVGVILKGELTEQTVPRPLCSPQTSHRLTWNRNRVVSMRGRRITAWAMARSNDRLEPELCISIQLVPRSKHTPSELYKQIKEMNVACF